jgi:membrane protease YdiL (CAAX protease family)
MQKSNALKEVSLFFGLTLALSYLVFWGPLALFQIPTISFVRGVTGPGWAIALFITGGFVPSLVAIFLTWKQHGVSGLRQLGRRILQFKIGWQWYLAAVAVVVISTLGQLATISLLGQTFDLALFPAQLGSAILLIVLGPLSEEIGWRGYALDRLQTKWNALVSSLMVGLVWGLWHGPLFYMVGTSQHELALPFVGFVGGVMAVSVLFTWLHNNTHGSLWTAILFHWVYTYFVQVVASGVTRGPLSNWVEYLPYWVVALIVVLIWKPHKLMAERGIEAKSETA